MFLWPVYKFWRFKPHAWLLAIAWNVSEILGVRIPFCGIVFGIIINREGKEVENEL